MVGALVGAAYVSQTSLQERPDSRLQPSDAWSDDDPARRNRQR